MNRHNWTSQQDSQLRIVVAEHGSEDWTKNAQMLRIICSTAQQKNRTGKQCRQRWYNHLDPNVVKSQWKIQQQNKLFQMHKIHGNKWKQLTKYLPGRTDNDIKNHFYSTLRRSLRRLNKYTGQKNSTNQMRQIKPSVLTFIINHIYSRDLDIKENKGIIDELRQLPQLVFKFSNFKPVKQNMDKKIDDGLKDRISIILKLVDQFKQLYSKDKQFDNQIQQNSNLRKRQSKKFTNQENKQYLNELDQNQELNQQQIDRFCVKQQQSQEQNVKFQNYQDDSRLLKTTKQFTPIVTIQRKPSTFQQKPTSKKLVMIQKTDQKMQEQPNHHFNLLQQRKALSFHQDDERQRQLMPIQEPSLSLDQNSNIFKELVIVGKHIQPIQCMATNQQQQSFSQIDQVLYENYQQ